MHGIAKVAVAVALIAFAAGSASADVTINEMKVKSTEYIELYNSGGSDVDVTDWTLDDGSGPEVLTGVVPAGGFLVIDTILTLNNGGAIVELRDAAGALIDDVGYGNMGGAPLGFNSIGRSPDGHDTDDWARDFEYADDNLFPAPETPGEPNIQGEPALGSGIIINELDPYGTGNPDELDRLELFNPTAAPIDVTGYWISDGDGYCAITQSITVPAFGFAVLTEDVPGEGMDCEGFDEIEFGGADVAYIYTPEGVRVDQFGYMDAPTVDPPNTFQRCPDGAGPNDSFDFASNEGGITVLIVEQTLGGPNNCPVPVESTSWGNVKAIYRD
jgi:hypothetical protein